MFEPGCPKKKINHYSATIKQCCTVYFSCTPVVNFEAYFLFLRTFIVILIFKSLAVSLRTTRFKRKIFYMLLALFGCFVWISEQTVLYGSQNRQFCRDLRTDSFVWISEQTATFTLYSINWLVFITVVERVYSVVRADSLYKADYV
jgi:hypothetical protein